MGMVGSGARTGSTANERAIPLASAVCLPRYDRRVSLHGFDVAAVDRVVVDQVPSPTGNIFRIMPMLFGVAFGFGLSAPAWLAILDLIQGSARELQSPAAHWQWLVPPAALPGLILPSWTVDWTDFSSRHLAHTATELACGLVAPASVT